MSKASIETYIDQVTSGKLNTDSQKIYQEINSSNGITIKSLRRKFSHQTLTARISELQDSGVVYESGVEKIGNTSFSVLKTEEDADQILQNRKDRKIKKFVKWLKKAEVYVDFLDPFISTSLSVKLDELKTNYPK